MRRTVTSALVLGVLAASAAGLLACRKGEAPASLAAKDEGPSAATAVASAPTELAEGKKAAAAEAPAVAGGGKGAAARGLADMGGQGNNAPAKPAAPPAPPPGVAAQAPSKVLAANPYQADGTVAPTPRTEPTLDPNGRFATTYRPGGGHLAAFDSAVSRGIVPANEREVVADLGARYSPDVTIAKGKALGIRTDLERAQLPPSGGPVHLRIALKSTNATALARPHLSVHLVLDVSGSMAGASIRNAREAARQVVDKLAPTDDFSLVTFSSDAEVKVPDGPVGARREQIKKTIEGIVEGGGTNIGAGLQLGYTEAHKPGIPEDAIRVVLLVSDGRVNAGITGTERLSKLALDAFQQGVQTSSFGLGQDYDGPLMSAIASEGAGGYYYLRDSEQIAPALSTEIDKRLDPVATALEVRVRLAKGVGLLHVYGSHKLDANEAAAVRAQEVATDAQTQKRTGIKRDRQEDAEGGMRFFFPAFARDDAHAMLLKLTVPEGVAAKGLATIEVKYKDLVAKKNVADETPVQIAFAASDAASAATADGSVARTIQGFLAGETLADAAARIANGDRAGASALLSEREGILRRAGETLGEPLFSRDADRLARLRGFAGGQTGMGDPLVLAMLLETSSRVHMH
jgi:Ca-activated chloride channel family protein